jgi:hypothetical protein
MVEVADVCRLKKPGMRFYFVIKLSPSLNSGMNRQGEEACKWDGRGFIK